MGKVLLTNASLSLVDAMRSAKLPRGVRWMPGGVAMRDGMAEGMLTREPRKGERRCYAVVQCRGGAEVKAAVMKAAETLNG